MKQRRDTVALILERAEPIPWTGCWIWLGAVSDLGYGGPAHNY